MKRLFCLCLTAFFVAGTIFAQDMPDAQPESPLPGKSAISKETNRTPDAQPDMPLPDKGVFIYWGLGYGYEKIGPEDSETTGKGTKTTSKGLNVLIGMGYDFGPSSMFLSLDCMIFAKFKHEGYYFPSAQYCYSSTYYPSTEHIDDGINGSIGAYIGLKLINSKVFDLTLPVGALIHVNNLNITNDSRKSFSYMYLNAGSGLTASFHIDKGFYITVPFYIGYPVWKARTVTNNTNEDFDVLNFSIGFCIKRLFG